MSDFFDLQHFITGQPELDMPTADDGKVESRIKALAQIYEGDSLIDTAKHIFGDKYDIEQTERGLVFHYKLGRKLGNTPPVEIFRVI